ncbi:MAG TPA: hypothetical protein DEW46_01190 [Verrucomicrobia bacterium]|nr:hypothetical protein [Verrucomicrobiota bacterium]
MGRSGRESGYLSDGLELDHKRLDGYRVQDFAGWDYTVCRTLQEGGTFTCTGTGTTRSTRKTRAY